MRGGASSQGAIATTEDRGERKGSCGSEVEEFDADATGGGGGRGWSREAHEKVTRRGFFAVMSTNMCNVKRTIAQHVAAFSALNLSFTSCIQVRRLTEAAVVTLQSKFPGDIVTCSHALFMTAKLQLGGQMLFVTRAELCSVAGLTGSRAKNSNT